MTLPTFRAHPWACFVVIITATLVPLGCYNTPVDTSDLARGPAPLRMPSPVKDTEGCCYEDSLTGGKVFAMYCGACHNPRSLAERPFSNYKNVAAHMRVRANLTGKENAELIAWLRRWYDVPPPNPPLEPSPKRLFFSQPIAELRPEPPAPEKPPMPGPKPLEDAAPPKQP
jgi:hypothetical protein